MAIVILPSLPIHGSKIAPSLFRNFVSATFANQYQEVRINRVHDAGTLIEDVIYAFSFFPLPLQRLSTFRQRESLGQQESEQSASLLLGITPPCFPSSLPPHSTCQSRNFHRSAARRSSDPLTATSTSRYVPGKSYAAFSPVFLSLAIPICAAGPYNSADL